MKLFGLSILLVVLFEVNCLNQGSTVSQAFARFVASVRLRGLDQQIFGNGFLCGATVIGNRDVLTTASCVLGRSSSDLQISMGTVDINRRSFVSNVQRITIHENFTESNPLVNNIAVLRFSSNIRHTSRGRYDRNINTHIQTIALDDTILSAAITCPVYAWANGRTSLLRAQLTTWNTNQCGNSSHGVVCAGNVNNSGPALCGNRNLGGPFVCNNRFTGFVIDSSGCGAAGTSGRLQSISEHVEWIRQVSGSDLTWKVSSGALMITLLLQIIL